MTSSATTDLFVLTADLQTQRTIETLLAYRRPALDISDISFDVRRHPRQDPGCRNESALFLETTRLSHRKALVVFDFEGCGENRLDANELELRLEQEFRDRGWEEDRAAVIVINPELEAWVFGATFRHIQRAVGWNHPQSPRDWLVSNGYCSESTGKPEDPKAALEALLFQSRRTRSAKVYETVARVVSLAHCQDRAFRKFRTTLHRWFPHG